MTQILIGNRGYTLEQLITRLGDCNPGKIVWMGPGYCGPKLEWYPQRFDYQVQLEFGITSWDHNKHLRPRKKDLVPEVTVAQYLEFLREIPGQKRELWKGGQYTASLQSQVCIGLFGEVAMDVVGVHEGSYDVTILSARL